MVEKFGVEGRSEGEENIFEGAVSEIDSPSNIGEESYFEGESYFEEGESNLEGDPKGSRRLGEGEIAGEMEKPSCLEGERVEEYPSIGRLHLTSS